MSIRKSTIAKLQELPEPLLQQVSDFVDFLTYRYQDKIENAESDHDIAHSWAKWFDAVETLEEIAPTEPTSTYSQLLLSKYRQQGLDL